MRRAEGSPHQPLITEHRLPIIADMAIATQPKQPKQPASAVRTSAGDELDYRPSYLAASIVAFAVFLLYIVTLSPSTAMWDTSEYISAAYTLGLPHPPGNPLFVLIGRVFAWQSQNGSSRKPREHASDTGAQTIVCKVLNCNLETAVDGQTACLNFH